MLAVEAVFEHDPAAARAARRFVGEVLEERGWRHGIETAELLTSEVVSNAILHARSGVVVRVHADGRRAVVEVADTSEVMPEPKRSPAESMTGRGLLLVEQLAEGWGARSEGAGKCVWFEILDVGPPAHR